MDKMKRLSHLIPALRRSCAANRQQSHILQPQRFRPLSSTSDSGSQDNNNLSPSNGEEAKTPLDLSQLIKNIKGTHRTSGPKMILQFTCSYEGDCNNDDDRRVTKLISKNSYENGVVLVRCPCEKLHLIADNLGWFGSSRNIEEIMREKGGDVVRRELEEQDLLDFEDSV